MTEAVFLLLHYPQRIGVQNASLSSIEEIKESYIACMYTVCLASLPIRCEKKQNQEEEKTGKN